MLPTLYALALAVLVVYGAHLGVLAWASGRASVRAAAGEAPTAPPGGAWPVVTVQLPLYNEAAVAERLIDACAALDYPAGQLELQVLDDSTDETRALVAARVAHWQARGRDIVHVCRAERTGYKAGALANGLRLARGDVLAVFDADFVPPPDFLRRVVPRFAAPDVGLVQARWAHLNAEDSLLTRVQAFGLDAHFAVEQAGRQALGVFRTFNGTAGVWRRACIDAAGGWAHDTLTEDLDLSYRAQMAGWRVVYAGDVAVPAELPASLDALRAQQHRWTKGAAETARKLLGPLWRAEGVPLRAKLLGTLHLTAHAAFPFTLLAALTHAPLLGLKQAGLGPGPLYFAVASLGLVGFAGFVFAQAMAQRALYPDWPRRLRRLPAFLAGSMGLALSNTRAFVLGLAGRRSAFVRTPKAGDRPWWQGRYAAARLPAMAWAEAALAVYCLAGLVAVVAWGEWAAVPFQAAFAAGFALLAVASTRQARRAGR